jgi:predicted ATPase/class 3 adenylate cyclase
MAVCPNCGEDNADKAKFCSECATPLKAAPTPQAEERKVVSILFVDLVGFTARSHDADPEDVRAALHPYHQRLKREIEGYGGTLEKFIGDAVMAVFGAPVAHEDDAERAVRAALRITEAIEELNKEVDLDLSIRAAVNTGEGLVSLSAHPQSGEGMVTGDVVNTASRLQGLAPVGGVVVGEITFRATRDLILYDQLEPVLVKGKPDPVPLWRALSARGRFGVDVETRYRTPFIGRDFDLATLKTAYQRMLRESSLQQVTLVGEPGVGKSRLLGEFASYVDDQPELVAWRQGRSLPYGEGITFWALGEIVKAQAGINESDSPQAATDKMAVAVNSVVGNESDRAWLQTRLAPLVGVASAGGVADKEESFAAWLRFLEAIANKNPVVLVFEDLHWADTALLEFIEHLLEWSTGVPILIVGTGRPELYENHPQWASGARNATTISLSPLTDSETAQLISALLSQAVLPAEIHAALLERAGGNPLYAEEFIRMLSDRRVLQQRGRTVTLDTYADIPVPDNVQALIAARLDTLAPDRKSLLHNAAVVGKVFWSGAVATLGDLEDQSTRLSLQELVRKELVRPAKSSSVEGQYEYSFWHAIIRDVAYGQIPRLHRAEKHHRIARWLEGVAGDRSPDYAEVLAHHLMQAYACAEASSQTDQTAILASPTTTWLEAAGDRALELNPAQARQYFETALRMTSEQEAKAAIIMSKLSATLTRLGHLAEARNLTGESIERLLQIGENQRAAECMVSLSDILWHEGHPISDGISLCERAVELLEGEPPGVEMVKALTNLAFAKVITGDPESALSLTQTALELAAEANSHEGLINALDLRGTARVMLGDAEGIGDLREAVRIGTGKGMSRETAIAYVNLTATTGDLLGVEPSFSLAQEALSFMNDRGLVEWQLMSEAHVIDGLVDLGRWNEAESKADALVQRADQLGSVQEKLFAALSKLYMTAWRGELDESLALLSGCLAEARRIRDAQTYLRALGLGAQVYCLAENNKDAMRLLEEFDQESISSPYERLFNLDVVRASVTCGDLPLAKQFSPVGPDRSLIGLRAHNALSARATIAEAEGKYAEARDFYEKVIHAWMDHGVILEQGHALLGLARCLISLGNSQSATEPLYKARMIFSRLDARPLIDEADRYLGQGTALSS